MRIGHRVEARKWLPIPIVVGVYIALIYVKHRRYGHYSSFTSPGDWVILGVVVGALLAVVGAGVMLSSRLPATSWRRAWASGAGPALTIAILVSKDMAAQDYFRWLLEVPIVALALSPLYRWGNLLTDRTQPNRIPGASSPADVRSEDTTSRREAV